MMQLQNAIWTRVALMVGGLSLSDLKREDGQTFVEYALVIGVISLGMVAAGIAFSGDIATLFTTLSTKLTNAI